jgi:hypothetical protein
MEPRHLIRAAIALSVLGHMALAAGVYFADAKPMEPREDNVSVDLVTPQELAEAEKKAEEAKLEPEPDKKTEPEFRLPDLTTRPVLDEQQTSAAAAAQPQSSQQKSKPETAAQPKQQAAEATPQQQPPQQQQSQQTPESMPQQQVQSAPQQQAALQPQPLPQSPPPAVEQAPPQPDPDITVKYGVMLGLPGFGGAPASEQADVAKADIAAFHRHLKTCLKLPANVSRNEDAMVKLRAQLSPDGRLVAEPTVIEVRRPAKAALLLQAAKQGLEACQPYSMLPADKYNEWKVLDLPFTPQDFGT